MAYQRGGSATGYLVSHQTAFGSSFTQQWVNCAPCSCIITSVLEQGQKKSKKRLAW